MKIRLNESVVRRVNRRTECETPTPEPREVLRSLLKRERASNKSYYLSACRERGVVIVDRAVGSSRPLDASANKRVL